MQVAVKSKGCLHQVDDGDNKPRYFNPIGYLLVTRQIRNHGPYDRFHFRRPVIPDDAGVEQTPVVGSQLLTQFHIYFSGYYLGP